MGAYFNKDGIYSDDRIVNYTTQGSTGARICLGFFGANGNQYTHVKLTAGGSSDRMHKFEFDGYHYNDINIHSSVTFYTYNGTSSPYTPALINWGTSSASSGIVNYYYSSSDDKVVIVLGTHGAYTGGFLYHQTGATHTQFDCDVLAYTSSTSSAAGVY